MANFYNPYQNRTTAQQPATPSQVPGAKPAGQNTNASQNFGYLNVNQLGSDQWGTGASFQGAARVAGINAIKNSMSTANPEDYAGMDEMRNYYRSALAGLPGQEQSQRSILDTQAQRGLSGIMSQLKSANAGRGTLGSRQYGGAAGDLASRANQDYLSSLIKARSSALADAGQINTGLGSLQERNLSERKYQSQQAQSLADLIANYMALDQGRNIDLAKLDFAGDEADKARQMKIYQNQHEVGSSMMGMGMAGSDYRIKENIREADQADTLAPFRKTKAYRYNYKDEKFGAGERISPMAQDLIDAGMGECVVEKDGVLHINYGAALGRMFSAISTLTAEIDRLKKAGA